MIDTLIKPKLGIIHEVPEKVFQIAPSNVKIDKFVQYPTAY